MLIAAKAAKSAGIMIARGDLAVECGYERLAEVQEEILWIAEAAHTPVIWATQVLESLAKTGLPSRAEVTDAAMGERAECVTLNKGPHIGSTLIPTRASISFPSQLQEVLFPSLTLHESFRSVVLFVRSELGQALVCTRSQFARCLLRNELSLHVRPCPLAIKIVPQCAILITPHSRTAK